MKARSYLTTLLLCLGALFATTYPVDKARAEVRVSFDFFYNTLSPYGEWVTVGNYGSAWHPHNVDDDWSPYVDGSWAYTDDGWAWVSNEPWGDVVYHYGRWVRVNDYGWCWVPGYEWAPAWVSWRSSNDYVGWAPLPPEAVWRPAIGFSIWIDSYCNIGPRYYRFCHVRDFCEPHIRRHCRPWRENVYLMGSTVNITNINYNYDNSRVYVGGPRLSYLESRVARPVRHLRFVDNDRYERSSISGDDYRIYRPLVASDAARAHERLRGNVARTLGGDRIDHGWRDSGDDNQRRILREQVQSEVNGLTPDNSPAIAVAKSDGGIDPRERRGKGNKAGKEMVDDPRRPMPGINGKKGDRQDVRPGIPVPLREDRVTGNDTPDKKDRMSDKSKDKERFDDPRRAFPGADKKDDRQDVRPGIPVPLREDRVTGNDTPDKKDRMSDKSKDKERFDDPRRSFPGADKKDDRPDVRPGVAVPFREDRVTGNNMPDKKDRVPDKPKDKVKVEDPRRSFPGADKKDIRPDVRKEAPMPFREENRVRNVPERKDPTPDKPKVNSNEFRRDNGPKPGFSVPNRDDNKREVRPQEKKKKDGNFSSVRPASSPKKQEPRKMSNLGAVSQKSIKAAPSRGDGEKKVSHSSVKSSAPRKAEPSKVVRPSSGSSQSHATKSSPRDDQDKKKKKKD